jgi:hypothetical protein
MGNGIRSNLELIERLRRKNAAFFEREESGTPSTEAVNDSMRAREVLQREENLPENHVNNANHIEHHPKEVKALGVTGVTGVKEKTEKKEEIDVKSVLSKIKSINIEELKEDESDDAITENANIPQTVTQRPQTLKENAKGNSLSSSWGDEGAKETRKTLNALNGLSLNRSAGDTGGTTNPPVPNPSTPLTPVFNKAEETQKSGEEGVKTLTSINQDISSMSKVPAALGLESVKIERDTSYAIAFCNPHIRRLLKHYKDDPFWSAPSREIINLCLLDTTNSFLDPGSILSMVGGMSDSERSRALRMGISYNQMISPAEASIAAKSIIFRMKLTRIHQFIREYDASSKSEAEVDLFIQNILYVSKHYGLSMEVENLSDLNLSEIFPEDEFSEGGLRVFPSFFAPLNEVLGYGGYLTGQLVTVAGAPARGKTTFLFNEAVNFALSGKRVLYFALADQDKADLILKFLAIFYGYRFLKRIEEEKGKEALLEFIENTYNGLVFPDAYADVGGYHNPLFDLSPSRIHARNPRLFLEDPEVKKVISRIDIVVETEVRPHIQDIQATVMSRSNEPDVVIIDYDRSIKARTTEGLYQEGEEIYDGLVALTKPKGGKKKLVIVASQINKSYWHLSDPPLQSLAESSRKQAISDIVITIGKNLEKSGVHEGFISLVKNRRGPTGKFGYFLLPTTNMVPWSPEYINEEKKKARKKKKEIRPEEESE